MVLKTYSLFELIEEPQLIPDKFLKDLFGTYTTMVNPDFLVWKSKEKALLTFMSSTLNSFHSSTHYRVLISLRGLEGLGEQILLHFKVTYHEP